MIPTFKNRQNKDIESASETLITSPSHINKFINELKPVSKTGVANQQIEQTPFDNYIEKRKSK